MKTVIEKMRSLRITTQMTVLVVAALAVAHMVIGLAIFSLYPRPDMEPSSRAAPPQLEFVARLLAATSDVQQRAEIVRTTRELIPELEIGALPTGTQRPIPGPRPDRLGPAPPGPLQGVRAHA